MLIIRALFITLLITGYLFAQDIIRGTYSYTYGDSESLVEARQTCKDLALRNAIESYAIFVESSTAVEDFQLKEDIIQTISAGYLTDIKIIEQKEEGRNITIIVEASLDSSTVQSVIENQINQKDINQTTQADIAGQEIEPVDHEKGDDLSDEKQNPFGVYKQRMSSVDNLWQQEKYSEALYALRKLKAEIDEQKPQKTGTYQWHLYSVISNHTALTRELIKIDYSVSQNRNIVPKGSRKSILDKSLQLNNAMISFNTLNSLTTNQKMVRKALTRRCNKTLDYAKKKYGINKR